jgi:tetratricopeptide (TPR) repeat protein
VGWQWLDHVFLGNAEEAIGAFEKAMRLNPLDPSAYMTYCGIGYAHFYAGDFDAAQEYAGRSLRYWASYAPALRLKLLATGTAGRSRETDETVARLSEVMPRVTVSSVMSMIVGPISPARQALCESALRKAGLPE